MNNSLRDKSKDELKALLEYLEKAKDTISNTLNNAKEIYENVVKKQASIKKELKGRKDEQD